MRASVGESAPRFVVNVTVVPLCTGVPLGSSTVARISVVPFAWTTELAVDSVIVDSCGASSGILSHAPDKTAAKAANAHTRRFPDRSSPVMMECIRIGMSNYNSPMNLAAKASAGLVCRDARAEAGYAMAALLVGLAVMAVFLSVAMPTWSHMIRRDKEEELVFRGTQYARAINQYQRKFANASPATLDVLIEQHLLRKKFRDPLSPNKDGEFQMLYLNTQGAAARGRGMGPAAGTGAGAAGARAGGAGAQPATTLSTTPSGGIVGVASKNTGTSIMVYKGKSRYNEWQFVGMEQSTQAGTGGAGGPAGPQRGGRGGRDGSGRDGGVGREGMGGPSNRGGFGGPGGTDSTGRGTRGGPSPQR